MKLTKKAYLFSDLVVVAASSTSQITFQVDAGYDFRMIGWSYVATALFFVQFYDNEKKIYYDYAPNEVFNGWWTGMVATGDRHFNQFTPPYLFKARSNINVYLQDRSGAQNTIKIVLDGTRLYYS